MGCTRCVVYFLLLGLLMPATSCLADGKVFATEAVQTSIPRQQALLCYRNGVETLAIQTQFVGKGSEFAWVVPLPSPPEVTPTTTGLFPTIDTLLVRELRTSPPYASVAAALIACVVLMNVLAVNGRIVTGLVIIVVLLAMVLAPSLGRAGGPVAAGATLLDRKPIGSYDVATLTGADAAGLVRWLNDHGFKVPPEVAPGLDHYIQKGWCFVAARLRTDAATDQPMSPHPLVFRFKSDAAVYPMYLTTLANGRPLQLDLYVLGDRQAEAKDFRTVQTRFAVYDSSQPNEYRSLNRPPSTEFPVAHPSLLQIADHAPYFTHLSTTIQAPRVMDDVRLAWRDFKLYQPTLYTYTARRLMAMDAALTLLIIGSLVVYLLTLDGKITRAQAPRYYGVVLFVALILGMTLRLSLSATASAKDAPRHQRSYWTPDTESIVEDVVRPAMDSARKFYPPAKINYEWLHYLLFTEGGALMAPRGGLGLPLHENDSPGSYILRPEGSSFELVGFDRRGKPHVVAFSVSLPPATQPAE